MRTGKSEAKKKLRDSSLTIFPNHSDKHHQMLYKTLKCNMKHQFCYIFFMSRSLFMSHSLLWRHVVFHVSLLFYQHLCVIYHSKRFLM